MNSIGSTALALAMIAAGLLLFGGAKLASRADSRKQGVLMIVAAAVLVMNVVIWTI